jgi:hypothetical protein
VLVISQKLEIISPGFPPLFRRGGTPEEHHATALPLFIEKIAVMVMDWSFLFWEV